MSTGPRAGSGKIRRQAQAVALCRHDPRVAALHLVKPKALPVEIEAFSPDRLHQLPKSRLIGVAALDTDYAVTDPNPHRH
jgi:hypothetical protein